MTWMFRGARGSGAGPGWMISLMAAFCLAFAAGVNGAESGSGDEVQRLRDELEKARQEIRQLREENARLKGPAPAVAPAVGATPAPAPAAAAGTPAAAAPVPASPAAPATAPAPAVAPGSIVLPAPIAEGATVTVAQLLEDYRTSALAGDAKYKGRRFRIEGKVHSFKKPFVSLVWPVQLQGSDSLGLVRCHVSFPGITDFRPSATNRVLEGRRPFKEWQVLLQHGQTVVLEGDCTGIDDAVVVFKNCKPVKP